MNRAILKKSVCLLLILCMLPLWACTLPQKPQQAQGLVINELVTSCGESLRDDKYGSPDWIELYNAGDKDINLFGYIITDDILNNNKGTLLPDAIVPAGDYILLYANKSSDAYEGGAICLNFALKQSGGETLTLMDANYNILDEVAIPELDRDISYARKTDGSFGYCSATTPGTANTTPTYDSSSVALSMLDSSKQQYSTVLVISEVVSDNVSSVVCNGCTACNDWVELYNTSDSEVSLKGFTLTDKESDAGDGNLGDFVVPAYGYALVYCCRELCDDSDGHICVDNLGINNKGETLFLYDSYGNLLTSLDVPALEDDVSWALRGDGSYAYSRVPTPGTANTTEFADSLLPDSMVHLVPVRINEVLPNNRYSIMDADGDRSDWVELYNSGSESVSLAGYYLSDSMDDLYKWAFPDVSIAPGQYLLVFLSGKERTDTELHASFALSEGETLVLFDSKLLAYQGIEIPALPDNVSISRAEDGSLLYYRQPTPLSENAHAFTGAEQLGFFDMNGVYISEVSSIHAKGTAANDWVELYNGGDSDISLNGWYLSDSGNNFQKWAIGDIVIPAGGYTVIETSSHPLRQTSGVANYGIASSGETMYLSDPAGNVVDIFATGVQSVGLTSGRVEGDNSISRVFYTTATKGKKNSSNSYRGYASQPIFSETGLYQSSPFTLSISSNGADAIYYTTDGSEPDKGSKLYSGPITVKKSCVIRSVAVCDGLLDSEITTCHYLFVEKHTLPVVCIAMSPSDFNTIYQVSDYKKVVERETFISFYEDDGLLGISFSAGLKAKGRGTLKYAQKSMTIRIRGSYGRSTVSYRFFDDIEFNEFGSLVLRNGGQDYDAARMRDSFASRIMANMNVDGAATRPVLVYVNGDYYGLYDFNEDLNVDYLATRYGADPDNCDLIRTVTTATQGDNKEIKRLRSYVAKNSLSNSTHYEEFCTWVDVDYFIDYVIAQSFIGNNDLFNQKYWRSRDYSIKWHPVFYDLDFAFRSGSVAHVLSQYLGGGNYITPNGTIVEFTLYNSLIKNADFKQRFIERYVQLICTELSAERMTAILDEMQATIAPEMARHISRWKIPSSYSRWESSVRELRAKVEARPEKALAALKSYFGLSTSELNALINKYS